MREERRERRRRRRRKRQKGGEGRAGETCMSNPLFLNGSCSRPQKTRHTEPAAVMYSSMS